MIVYDHRTVFQPIKKQLAQLEPNAKNTAETLYTKPLNTESVVTQFTVVSNAGGKGGDIDYVFFNDDDGTTYDDSTRIAEETAKDGDFSMLEVEWSLGNEEGTIGFEAEKVDCVVTIWGTETRLK